MRQTLKAHAGTISEWLQLQSKGVFNLVKDTC